VSRASAFVIDGLHSTRPIEFPVGAPREADAMFDVLTYEKGASVLRMLEQYLGPDVFRAGVRDYLRAHLHDNADTGDLWAALGRALDATAPSTAVLLLDANRPLLSPPHLADLVAQAAECPAVLSAAPVRSTCKQVVDGTITATLRREHLLHARRPAAFQRPVLREALARAAAEGRPAAGDVELCRWAGVPVRLVEDGSGNLSVESAADAELVELMLRPAPLAR
jgi:hypothetical protein